MIIKSILISTALTIGLTLGGPVTSAQAFTLQPVPIAVQDGDVVSIHYKRKRHKHRRRATIGIYLDGIYIGGGRNRHSRRNRYYDDDIYYGQPRRYHRGRFYRPYPGFGPTYDANGFVNEK